MYYEKIQKKCCRSLNRRCVLIGFKNRFVEEGTFEMSFEEKTGFCQLHMEAVETSSC